VSAKKEGGRKSRSNRNLDGLRQSFRGEGNWREKGSDIIALRIFPAKRRKERGACIYRFKQLGESKDLSRYEKGESIHLHRHKRKRKGGHKRPISGREGESNHFQHDCTGETIFQSIAEKEKKKSLQRGGGRIAELKERGFD